MKHDLGTSVVFPSAQHREQVPLRHRLIHYLSFGATAAVLILAARTMSYRVLGLFTVISLSLFIECGQSFVGGLDIEWWDVRDDALSATAIFIAFLSPAVRHRFVQE
jgi:VanZ family protein